MPEMSNEPLAGRMRVGPKMVAFRTLKYAGSDLHVQTSNNCVDVQISNGRSYVGLYISPEDARDLARALLLAADTSELPQPAVAHA